MSNQSIICPGQGLLLLMSYYKNDSDKVAQLKQLYLSGATNDTNRQLIDTFLADPVLASYQINFDMNTVNADPTRRYFETHLSYATLKYELNDQMITKDDLDTHIQMLINMIPPSQLNEVQHVLDGNFKENDSLVNQEYADFISKLKSGALFQDLPSQSIDKITQLVKSAFLGFYNVKKNDQHLPLNIYRKGIYSDEQKGKFLLQDQETTRNSNFGLLKGYMPLARDDEAYSNVQIPYLKPSDQAGFNTNALWVEQNFKKLVHPFSNSISGTMLCQLRSIAQLAKNHQNDGAQPSVFTESNEKLAKFCKLLTSTMLFGGGGHTLYEFIAVLSLPEVKREFGYHEDMTLVHRFTDSVLLH